MALIKIKRLNTKNMFNPLKYKRAMDRRIPKILNFAGDIIVEDIKRAIEQGNRDITGKQFKPLKPATIASKRKSKSKTPRIPLSNKGIMKKVYISKRAISTSLGVQIRVAKKRSKPITGFPHGVGQIQHEGTEHIPARPWFGISPTAVKRIDKMLGLKLAKELKNSWGLR